MQKTLWVPQGIVSALLLWALSDENPYGYYIFLRLVCCGVFAYLALKATTEDRQGWAWAFGLTAVLYNPVIRVHLDRETWSVINVATVGLALLSIWGLRPTLPSRHARAAPSPQPASHSVQSPEAPSPKDQVMSEAEALKVMADAQTRGVPDISTDDAERDEYERQLLKEYEAVQVLARAQAERELVEGTQDGNESGLEAMFRELPASLVPTKVGIALMQVVTVTDKEDAKDPATLWGALIEARPACGPGPCDLEITALRMAAVDTAIIRALRDGLHVPDEACESYWSALDGYFEVWPYTETLVNAGAVDEHEEIRDLLSLRGRVFAEAAEEPDEGKRWARMMRALETRCGVEDGTLGLSVPSEFDDRLELALRVLRAGAERLTSAA